MAQSTPNHTQIVSGWAAHDASGKITPFTFKRRETGVTDVSIKILYCGICHTDLHHAKNDWGITMYPVVPGHEIIGLVTKVGSDVKGFKEGDRVGVGCLAASCLDCEYCKTDQENYCDKLQFVYNGIFWDGSITYGGYSQMFVADYRYVVHVPENLPMDAAAPLLCAGITVFSPMKDHNLVNSPGKKIGIVGLGGLGHVAVKFGKAFGHHVTVISTSPSKETEAKQRLGADDFILSSDPKQLEMTCSGWFCSPRRTGGRSRKQCEEDNLCRKSNVNEEYLETFRTKSYIEICNKAQVQLGKTTSTRRLSSSSSPSSSPLRMHLTEYLLEPRQEVIASMSQKLKVHHLLVEYFDASLEACRYCDTILEGIQSMRLAYRRITRVVKLSKRVLQLEFDDSTSTDKILIDDHKQTKKDIYRELALQNNNNKPLSFVVNTMQFHDIHERYMELLQRLTSKRGRIRRRLTLMRICKKVGGIALVTSHGAVLIALLVISFHSIVGLVAAPCILGCLFGLFIERMKRVGEKVSTSYSERLCEQLDAAAKGVFIMINDLDTMSRMVKRLQDEVEHRKLVADVCVRNGKSEILKRVVMEFDEHESSFLEQLNELEEHVYLCFLTVNRSRRLVLQEIT